MPDVRKPRGKRDERISEYGVSVSRSLLSQLFVEAVGRFAQMSADGGCHINWRQMSDVLWSDGGW